MNIVLLSVSICILAVSVILMVIGLQIATYKPNNTEKEIITEARISSVLYLVSVALGTAGIIMLLCCVLFDLSEYSAAPKVFAISAALSCIFMACCYSAAAMVSNNILINELSDDADHADTEKLKVYFRNLLTIGITFLILAIAFIFLMVVNV